MTRRTRKGRRMLLFAKPLAIFLTNKLHRFANFLQMQRHRFFHSVRVTFFERAENIVMLSEQHFRWRDVIETHIPHAIDGGFDVFDGVPGELAIRNLRQFLVEFIIELEEVI